MYCSSAKCHLGTSFFGYGEAIQLQINNILDQNDSLDLFSAYEQRFLAMAGRYMEAIVTTTTVSTI
jgi:hypothetical protein